MGSASFLATILDQEMLEVAHGVTIAARDTKLRDLPERSGTQVATQLGGRYLLRFALTEQCGFYKDGSDSAHWATPTPYPPQDTVSFLALPRPAEERLYVWILNPSKIDFVRGPRWVRFGNGIEYHLPKGFPKAAIVHHSEVLVW